MSAERRSRRAAIGRASTTAVLRAMRAHARPSVRALTARRALLGGRTLLGRPLIATTVTKDSVALNASLALLYDARKHIEAYQSTAEDSGAPQRTARHFLQRILNRTNMELSDTQAAMMLLGNDAHGSSETFHYINLGAALDEAKKGCEATAPNERRVGRGKASGDTIEVAPADERWATGTGNGSETQVASGDDPDMGSPARIYTGKDGAFQAVAPITHYLHRGYALRHLSFYEYLLVGACNAKACPPPSSS